MNQNTVPGGSRGATGNSSQSGDFDGQHTYVIQDSRRESQDEELEGAGIHNSFCRNHQQQFFLDYFNICFE